MSAYDSNPSGSAPHFAVSVWRNVEGGKPRPLGKYCSLDADGELVKETIVPNATEMTVGEFSNLAELQALVAHHKDCFIATGLPNCWSDILDEHQKSGSNKEESWQRVELSGRRGPGVQRTAKGVPHQFGIGTVCVIDFDSDWCPLEPLPDENLRTIIIEAAALGGLDLSSTQMLFYRSSGSACVRESDGYEFDKGGRHLVFLVEDAGDLHRFGEAMQVYLALAGYAYGGLSSAGSFLRKSIMDPAALRASQPIFTGPPAVAEGLSVDRKERLIGGDDVAVDTRQLLDPTPSELAQVRAIWRQERRKLNPEVQKKRDAWLSARIQERLKVHPEQYYAEAEREVLMRVNGALFSNDIVHLDNHGWLTVGEILSNPAKYDGDTCADPVEPEYGGGRNKGMIFINEDGGFPVIHSFAHGSSVLRLLFDVDSAVEHLRCMSQQDRLRNVEKVVGNTLCTSVADIERLRELLADQCQIRKGLTRNYEQILEANMLRYGGYPDAGGAQSDTFVVDHVFRATEGWLAGRIVVAVGDQIYDYTGTHWRLLTRSEAAHQLQTALFASMPNGWYRKSHGSLTQRTEEAVKCLYQLAPQRPELFDQPPIAINCRNGEVWFADDGSFELRPHDPESGFRHVIDVDFDPHAESALLLETLSEMFFPPNRVWNTMSEAEQEAARKTAQDVANFVLEVLAYLLVPRRWLPAWFFFYGRGNDGKSMLTRLLMELLPEEAVTQERIDRIHRDSHGTARLDGCVLLVDDDMPADSTFPDDFLKKFSEGGLISSNPKFMEQRSFTNTAGVVLCSNNVPRTVDVSVGMKRRAFPIRFTRSFKRPEDLQAMSVEERETADVADTALPEKLRAELTGVLAELVRAYGNLVERGSFELPQAIIDGREELFRMAHPLQTFVDDECERGPEFEISTAEFRRHLLRWAEDNVSGWRPSQQQVNAQVEQLGCERVKKSDTTYFRGLKLRESQSDSTSAFVRAGLTSGAVRSPVVPFKLRPGSSGSDDNEESDG